MRCTAFATLSCGLRVRACASSAPSVPSVIVDNVCERTAAIAWPASSTGPYRVMYGLSGEPLTSLRTAWLPNVELRNLRPGSSYTVQVLPDGGTASFNTVASVDGSGTDTTASIIGEQLPLTELSRLEIRVGRVIECDKHPEADTLYVEQVDVGEPRPRTIVSGLVKFLDKTELIGRPVVVLCNLKPRTMRGVTSHGMLLCASNEDHTVVDPLAAPDGAQIGELVSFKGHRQEPAEVGNRVTKAFDRVAADLKTSPEGIAQFQDVQFETSAGPCFSPAGLHGSIS
jgi:methionine--tRNA ligase beta chain